MTLYVASVIEIDETGAVAHARVATASVVVNGVALPDEAGRAMNSRQLSNLLILGHSIEHVTVLEGQPRREGRLVLRETQGRNGPEFAVARVDDAGRPTLDDSRYFAIGTMHGSFDDSLPPAILNTWI